MNLTEQTNMNGNLFETIITGNMVKLIHNVSKHMNEPFLNSAKLYNQGKTLFAVIADKTNAVYLNLGDTMVHGEDFEFLLPLSLFKRLGKRADATFRFGNSVNKGHIAMFAEGNWEHLLTHDVTDFPEIKDVVSEKYEVVTAGYTEALVSAVKFAGRERIVTAINGIHHNAGMIEATDGNRIYRHTDVFNADVFEMPFLVDASTALLLDTLTKGEAVATTVDYENCILKYEGNRHTLVAKFRQVAYPDFDSIIPKNGFTGNLTVNRRNLLDALNGVEGAVELRMSQAAQTLEIYYDKNGEVKRDIIDCVYISLKSSFNNQVVVDANHIVDMLKTSHLNDIEIQLSGNHGAMIVDVETSFFLIFPVMRG